MVILYFITVNIVKSTKPPAHGAHGLTNAVKTGNRESKTSYDRSVLMCTAFL